MRNEITLTDEKIEAAFGDILTVDDLTFTRETIADYLAARAGFAERGSIEKNADGVLIVKRVQISKCQPRNDLHVIDFGTVRAVYVG